jgi:hypothetical protein
MAQTQPNYSQILGKMFREYIKRLKKDDSLKSFMLKNYDRSRWPPNATDKDVHPEFFQKLVAITYVFRELEKPIPVTESQIVKDFITDALNDIVKNEGKTYENILLYEANLLYKAGDPIKFLVPGSNIYAIVDPTFEQYFKRPLPQPQPKGQQPTSPRLTSFTALVLFLMIYISLLDLDNITGRTVINFMSENDNLHFNRYVYLLIRDLQYTLGQYLLGGKYYQIPNLNLGPVDHYNAILDGLIIIADNIINLFKSMGPDPKNDHQYVIAFLNPNNYVNNIISMLTNLDGYINGKNNKIKLSTIFNTFNNTITFNPNNKEEPIYEGDYLDDKNYVLNKQNPDSDILVRLQKELGRPGPTGPTGPQGPQGMTGPTRVLLSVIPQPTTATSSTATTATISVVSGSFLNDKINSAKFLYDNNGNIYQVKNFRDVRDIIKDLSLRDSAIFVILGFIYSMIKHGKTYNFLVQQQLQNQPQLQPDEVASFQANIKDAYNKYYIIKPRLAYIDNFINNIQLPALLWQNQDFQKLYNDFINGYTNHIITAAATTQPLSSKRTLAEDAIFDLYKNVIIADQKFYEEFFDLVDRKKNQILALNTAAIYEKGDHDLENYRLNVRKLSGERKASAIQLGGVSKIVFGDIVLVKYIPDYPKPSDVNDIWIDWNNKLERVVLERAGVDVLAQFVRDIYRSTGDIVLLLNRNINLRNMVNIFSKPSVADLRSLINTSFPEPIQITPYWVKREVRIWEFISDWVREGDTFVRRDAQGRDIPWDPLDGCAFIKMTGDDCEKFLNECAFSNDDNFPDKCKDLLDADFDIPTDPGMASLKEKIIKVNPKIAFAILRKFGFGSYLDSSDGPVPGMRRFRVQSVSSWIGEIQRQCQMPLGPNPTGPASKYCTNREISLRAYLGDDVIAQILDIAYGRKKSNLLVYLQILVDWVNANPQVLNKEELKAPEITPNYPEPTKEYNIYDYLQPEKPPIFRLRNMFCGLERLKMNLSNEIIGQPVKGIVATIASTPTSLDMPFNRVPFTMTVPIIPMTGGDPGNIIISTDGSELSGQTSFQYGYKFFDSLFQDLINSMKSMQSGKRIKLKPETQEKIRTSLRKLKDLEDELQREMINLIKRNQLFRASKGYIDAFGIPDENLPAILEKHSNLLGLSNAYNRRASNLIDIYQAIIQVILERLQDKSSYPYKYPISMNYPTRPIPPPV